MGDFLLSTFQGSVEYVIGSMVLFLLKELLQAAKDRRELRKINGGNRASRSKSTGVIWFLFVIFRLILSTFLATGVPAAIMEVAGLDIEDETYTNLFLVLWVFSIGLVWKWLSDIGRVTFTGALGSLVRYLVSFFAVLIPYAIVTGDYELVAIQSEQSTAFVALIAVSIWIIWGYRHRRKLRQS